jgi:leucyl aminopeptidase (aminopeptidase T)
MAAEEAVREGVVNLVDRCAEVGRGERVLVLNENGKVSPEIATAIEKQVRARGAECYVLWGDSIDSQRTVLPKVLIAAFLAADKVVANFSLNRVILDEYTQGKGVIQINNTCRNPELMGSPHARFHWGLVKAICARLEEIFAGAERWRIASPAGTDISGRIGKGSMVADAYFSREASASRFIRVFPGEVYSPVGSVEANGRIVTEYINARDQMPWDEPVTLTVKENRVIKIEAGNRAKNFERAFEENQKQFGEKAVIIDSWHGGMNPKARVPTAENRSLQGASSSPAMMHFHLGTLKSPISVGILNPTVEIDGKKIYQGGKLLILDDPKIKEAERGLAA